MPYKDSTKQRAAQAKWAREHRPTMNRNKAASYRRLKERVDNIKTNNPCTDCKHYWPSYVMQFDHIGDDKTANVSELALRRHAKWEVIEAEIAKCELVCANCHAIRTHRRFGSAGRTRTSRSHSGY